MGLLSTEKLLRFMCNMASAIERAMARVQSLRTRMPLHTMNGFDGVGEFAMMASLGHSGGVTEVFCPSDFATAREPERGHGPQCKGEERECGVDETALHVWS